MKFAIWIWMMGFTHLTFLSYFSMVYHFTIPQKRTLSIFIFPQALLNSGLHMCVLGVSCLVPKESVVKSQN